VADLHVVAEDRQYARGQLLGDHDDGRGRGHGAEA
jgi:hypothetical protein